MSRHSVLQSRRGRLLMAAVALSSYLSASAGLAHAGSASIVVDAGTGQVLSGSNPDALTYPASLTKMMTLYLAFEALQGGRLRWDQQLPVSAEAAARVPTKLGVAPGQTISVQDCVLGMIVLSANDAATVMAEALGGTEAGFALLMTAKARALGMTRTTFSNASGLTDPRQVTTARDMSRLATALYRDFPRLYTLFSTHRFVFRGRTITGHNRLMYGYAGMDGLKTGFTRASGYNIATSAVRNGRRLFGVVMGGPTAAARDRTMAQLLDDAFAPRGPTTTPVAQAASESTSSTFSTQVAQVFSALGLGRGQAAPVSATAFAAVDKEPVPPEKGREAVPATWAVEIGSYSQEAQAREALRRVATLSGLTGQQMVVPTLIQNTTTYRARLAGLSERQAREGCRTLKPKNYACQVLSPAAQGS